MQAGGMQPQQQRQSPQTPQHGVRETGKRHGGHGVVEPDPGHASHAGHVGHDRSGLLEGMPPMLTTGSTGQSWQRHQLQLHNLGQCFPCIAFALQPAGCFKGDECRHCHFCNAQQAKARRRQLQQAARRQKRRRGKYGEELCYEVHEAFSCVKASRFLADYLVWRI